jgi:hypothetical protein
MRQCTQSTANKIARLDKLPTKPTWLKLALADVRNGKPMSAERERRMCDALGIEAPTRKPYWRPCLPATLTTEQRAQVVALAQLLEDKP